MVSCVIHCCLHKAIYRLKGGMSSGWGCSSTVSAQHINNDKHCLSCCANLSLSLKSLSLRPSSAKVAILMCLAIGTLLKEILWSIIIQIDLSFKSKSSHYAECCITTLYAALYWWLIIMSLSYYWVGANLNNFIQCWINGRYRIVWQIFICKVI